MLDSMIGWLQAQKHRNTNTQKHKYIETQKHRYTETQKHRCLCCAFVQWRFPSGALGMARHRHLRGTNI
jgi:hypothetical protein